MILQMDSSSELRLSESIHRTLVEWIVSGQLTPGEVISEVTISKELGVSRTPVHEAIRQLVSEGLVIQRTNRRPEISELSEADLEDIFDMRVLLESEAARRAASRIERSSLEQIAGALDSLEEGALEARSASDREAWIITWADCDDEFHCIIAAASGSPRLAKDIARYRLLHRAFNTMHTEFEGLQNALREHRIILAALENKDEKAASDAMMSHIRGWQAFFVNSYAKASGRRK